MATEVKINKKQEGQLVMKAAIARMNARGFLDGVTVKIEKAARLANQVNKRMAKLTPALIASNAQLLGNDIPSLKDIVESAMANAAKDPDNTEVQVEE